MLFKILIFISIFFIVRHNIVKYLFKKLLNSQTNSRKTQLYKNKKNSKK